MKRRADYEYKKFDDLMTQLLKVPHSQIKAQLDAEKAAKRKPKTSARASRAKED